MTNEDTTKRGSTAVAKRGTTAVRRSLSVDDQIALMKSKFKLSVTLIETHEILANPNGTYTLVKRAKPIKLFDNGKGNYTGIVQETYADKIKINTHRRGKYNDEARLTLSSPLSVEPHETIPFGIPCN